MEKNQDSPSLIREYLIDAIAAEKNFETQLTAFAKEARQNERAAAEKVFLDHAYETKSQHQRLTERLEAIGGSPSSFKSFIAHAFASLPRVAQTGHDPTERQTQNLIIAYAAEHSEIALYEALAVAAATAGDLQTEQLAREIQQEERAAAEKVWKLIAPNASHSFKAISDAEERNPNLKIA